MAKLDFEVKKYLENHAYEWTNAKNLGLRFGCTSRTIRNVISRINDESSNTVLSSKYGYRYNNEKSDHTDKNNVFETNEIRRSKLLIDLLHAGDHGIDVFEYSELQHISDATVRSDFSYIQKQVEKYGLKIRSKNFVYKLTGPEKGKRKLIRHQLYSEIGFKENVQGSIQELLGNISLSKLRKIVIKVSEKNGLFMNEYALNNIVLHFAIALQRLSLGITINDVDLSNDNINIQNEVKIVKEIVEQLNTEYEIEFSNIELEQLAILFVGVRGVNSDALDEYILPEIKSALKDSLQKLEQDYFLDFSSYDFFEKLAVHIQNLYYRSRFSEIDRGSYKLDIKTTYPLIYDMSVYLAVLLKKKLPLKFTEEEINFVALHIGSFFEEQKVNKQKLKVCLISTVYDDVRQKLMDELEKQFSESIEISLVSPFVQEKNMNEIDLIITTEKITDGQTIPIVKIHPFLLKNDKKLISEKIQILKYNKFGQQITRNIKKYMSKDLYYDNQRFSKRQEVLSFLLTEIYNKGMISDKYISGVWEREAMSATSFPSQVAIPHAVRVNSNQTFISIYKCDEPIIWQSERIKFVFLIGIEKSDAKKFNEIFEVLVSVLSSSENVNKLYETGNYENFMKILNELLDNESIGEFK